MCPIAPESASLSCLSASGCGDEQRGKVHEKLRNDVDICNDMMSLSFCLLKVQKENYDSELSLAYSYKSAILSCCSSALQVSDLGRS